MEEETRWKLPTEDQHDSKTEAVAVITGADVLSGLNDSVVEHSASFVARNEQLVDEVNDASLLTTQEKLCLSNWGLPETILERYASRGVVSMFPWQLSCLQQGSVLSGRNLVYSAPTSAGKTLVAEILAIKTVLERRKKVIFVLPFVSVVREKMHYFQHLLSTSGIRVAGLMGSQSLPGGFSRVHMAICTIEKANSLVNRLLEEGTLGSLGALVVDELHLIGDPFRGYLLELLLAKVKFVAERLSLDIQIIGMSATLPNLDHLATWLDAELFTTDFRPVPLKELFKCGDDVYDRDLRLLYRIRPQIKINNDPDHVIHMCLETVTNGHSALIFCPTKVWCESLATSLASNVRTLGCGTGPLAEQLRAQLLAAPLTELLGQLRSCAAGLDAVLGRCVQYGVAFHHAGLTMDEREILEAGFRGNVLRLLVATSTLSSGVNLPARRVIVRTAHFHGKPLEAAAYHQMAGRAGRTGCDTQGESFLMFKPNEMAALRRMVAAQPAAVRSCLEPPAVGLASSMKRALLEVIAGSVANTMEELRHFVSCTLMGCMTEAESLDQDETEESIEAAESMEAAVSSKTTENRERWPLQAYIAFLMRNELIRRQETGEGDDKRYRLVSTALGGACLASALHPDEALALFRELQRARQSFVLENDLHVVYLVTPYSVAAQLGHLDWMQVLRVWKRLPPDLKRVGALVGVREAALASGAAGALPADGADVALTRRFHTALALLELLNEAPLARVAAEFGCSRGLLQALQQGAATYAGVVRAFCSRLRWHTLERLVEEFAPRLELGVARELLPLARLELLDGPRARAVHDAGFTSLPALAAAQVCDVETALMAATPFQSVAGVAGESAYDAARRQQRRLVCLTGRAGLTERQAAEMLIVAARELVQRDLELATEALMPANRQQPVTPSSLRNVSALSDCDESQAETLPRFVIGLQEEKRPRASKKTDLHSTSKTSHKSLSSSSIETIENDVHAIVKKDSISTVAQSALGSQCLKSSLKSPERSFISLNLQFVSEVKDRLSCGIPNTKTLSHGAGLDKPATPLILTPDLSMKAPGVLADNPETYPMPPLIEAGHEGRTECSESDTSVENTPPSTRTSKRMEKILQHRSNSGVKYTTVILPSQELDDSPEFGETFGSKFLSVQHSAVAGNSCEQTLSKLKVNLSNGRDSAKLVEINTNKLNESRTLGIKSVGHCQNNVVPSGRSVTTSPAKPTTARDVPVQVTRTNEIQEFNVLNTTASLRYQSPKHIETTLHVGSTSKTNLSSHLACSTPENADNLRLPSRHTPDIADIPQCDTDLFSSPLELPNLTAMLRLENGLASNCSLGENKNLSARSRVSIDMFDSPSPLPAGRPLANGNCLPLARESGALDSPPRLPRIGNQGGDSPVKLANAACRLSLDSCQSSLFGDSLVLESQFDRAVGVANGDAETPSHSILSDNECEGPAKDLSYFNESETMIKVCDSSQIFGGRDRLSSPRGPDNLGNLNKIPNNNRIESPASELKVISSSLFQSFEVDMQFNIELNAINEKDKAINKREKSEVGLNAISENLKTELDENAVNCDTNNIPKHCSIAKALEVALMEGKHQNVIAQGCNSKLNSIHSKVNAEPTKNKSSSLNFEDSLSIDTQLNLVLNSEISSKIFQSPPKKSKQSFKTLQICSIDMKTFDIAPAKSTSINFEDSLTLDTQLNLVLDSSIANPASKISPEHSVVHCDDRSQSSPEMFDESLAIDTQLGLAIDAVNQTTSRAPFKAHSSREVTDKSVVHPVLAISSLPRDTMDLAERPLVPTAEQILHKSAVLKNKPLPVVLPAVPETPPHLPTKSMYQETSSTAGDKNEILTIPNKSGFFIDSPTSEKLDMNINSAANDNSTSLLVEDGSALQNNSFEDLVMCTPPSTACSSKSFARGGKRKKKRKLSPEAVLSCKKAKGVNDAYRERDTDLPSESFASNGVRCSVRSAQSRQMDSGKVQSSGILNQSGRFYEVNSKKDAAKQNGNKHETKMTCSIPSSKRSVAKKLVNDGPVGESEKLVSQALAMRWCGDLDLDGSWQLLEAALESGADVALGLAFEPAAKKSGPLIGSAILGRRSIPSDTSVPSGQAVVTGFALSFGGMEAFFVPLDQGTDKGKCRGLRLLHSLRNLRMYRAQEQLTALLRSCQVSLDARLFDPLVADWLLDSTRPDPGLLVATQRECGSPRELLALLGRLARTEMKPARHVRPLRAALDAVCGWHLAEFRKEQLTGVPSDVVEVEMSVLPILAASDCAGMLVDCASKSRLRDQITAAILQHPAQARKCRAMLAALNGLGLTERVRPQSDPLGATGRITTRTPNVQCTPRDIALPHDATLSLRSIFIAPPGEVLVAADFCQLELRLLAHLSGDTRLREAVTVGGDAFAHLASSWYCVRLEQVSDEQRSTAKAACYGLIYGMGTRLLADKLGIDLEAAVEVVQQFNAAFPGAATFVEQTLQGCRKTGYITTLCGRRRYLPAITSNNSEERSSAERQAVNSTIQGSAADVFKRAMVNVWRLLPPGAKLVLHLHDELMVEVIAGSVQATAEALKLGMSRAVSLSVPLPVKITSGPSWADQKELRG